jgi:hypothetical protein
MVVWGVPRRKRHNHLRNAQEQWWGISWGYVIVSSLHRMVEICYLFPGIPSSINSMDKFNEAIVEWHDLSSTIIIIIYLSSWGSPPWWSLVRSSDRRWAYDGWWLGTWATFDQEPQTSLKLGTTRDYKKRWEKVWYQVCNTRTILAQIVYTWPYKKNSKFIIILRCA